MGLNELFQEVVVLNVDKRYKEFERIEQMLQNVGYTRNIKRVIVGKGEILPEDEYSIIDEERCSDSWSRGAFSHLPNSYHAFKSFQKIIGDLYNEGIKTVLILEDDAIFTDNFTEVLDKAEKDIREQNLHWDMLYLGANHTWSQTREQSPNLLRLLGSLCWHAVGIHHSVYLPILQWKADKPIDLKSAEILHPIYNCYAVWPTIAEQAPGFSVVEGRERNYHEFFTSKGANW